MGLRLCVSSPPEVERDLDILVTGRAPCSIDRTINPLACEVRKAHMHAVGFSPRSIVCCCCSNICLLRVQILVSSLLELVCCLVVFLLALGITSTVGRSHIAVPVGVNPINWPVLNI